MASDRLVDVAVVGGGIVGLAAAEALARRGLDVVCFEAGEPGGQQSAGLTRIFRHRHDRERLVELAVEARGRWRDWERRCGRLLLGSEGVVHAGADPGDAERLARAGVDHAWLDATSAHPAPPLFGELPAPLLFDRDGGAIRARRAVEALMGFLGARLVDGELIDLDASTDEVALRTVQRDGDRRVNDLQPSAGDWRCRRALLCAGAHTRRLAAAAGLELPPLSYFWQARPTFRVRPGFLDVPLPGFTDGTGAFGGSAYGSAVGGSGRYAVGFSASDTKQHVDDPRVAADDAQMAHGVERVAEYVARALPALHPEPESARVCVTSELPDGADRFGAWRRGAVTAFAGANLFKFAPVLGERLADAIVDDRVPADLVLAAGERSPVA